jgi:hypothetical protein
MSSLDLSRRYMADPAPSPSDRLSIRTAVAVVGSASLLAWAGIIWVIG